MNQQNQPKLPKESPFFQSKRPHWRDFRRFGRSKKEPSIVHKEPGVPIGLVIKRLWFPILLIPLTIFIAVTYSQRPWNIFSIPFLEPSPAPKDHRPLDETPTPTPTQDSPANWKTYINSAIGVEFKYPNAWSVQEDPLTLTSPTNTLRITIVSFNPNIVGISYCEAYPQDSPRCETITTTDGTVIIDWGEEDSPVANAMFTFISNVIVTLDTNPDIPARLMLTTEDKDFFRTLLSTFKFLEKNQEEYVIGIQTKLCCPCPKRVQKSQLGKEGWVEYQEGENYYTCPNVQCLPCPPIQNLNATDEPVLPSPATEKGCVIGGCSGEICANQEMFSTCIFRPESICYGQASCEHQLDGSCGWTQTPELTECLKQY